MARLISSLFVLLWLPASAASLDVQLLDCSVQVSVIASGRGSGGPVTMNGASDQFDAPGCIPPRSAATANVEHGVATIDFFGGGGIISREVAATGSVSLEQQGSAEVLRIEVESQLDAIFTGDSRAGSLQAVANTLAEAHFRLGAPASVALTSVDPMGVQTGQLFGPAGLVAELQGAPQAFFGPLEPGDYRLSVMAQLFPAARSGLELVLRTVPEPGGLLGAVAAAAMLARVARIASRYPSPDRRL